MFNNKMIYGIIGVLIIIIIGFSLYWILNQEEQPQPFTYLPILNHEQFQTKFNSNEEFFVYIGRPDCGDSIKFEQEFKQLFVEIDKDGDVDLLYNLDQKNFYYLDISEIIDSTKNVEKRMEYKELYHFYYTPTLIHYKDINEDGVIEPVRIAEWDATYGFLIADYMEWFYDTGLITPNDQVYHDGGTDKQ